MRFLLVLIRNILVNLWRVLAFGVKKLLRPRGAVDYVRFDLKGSVPLKMPPPRVPRLLRGFFRAPPKLTLLELYRALDQLEKAPRVRGVILIVRSVQLGWGALVALRARLQQFREAGKRVVIHLVDGANPEYYLASVADELTLPSGSHVWLTGLAAEVRFFKDALAKASAEAEVVAIGKYKNAMDPLVRNRMSDAHREATEAYLDDVSREIVRGIANGRGLSEEEVKKAIDEGPYPPGPAEARKLVDGVIYADELAERLTAEGERKPRIGPYSSYRRWTPRPLSWVPLLRRRLLGWVDVEGMIHMGESRRSLTGGSSAGHETVVQALEAARKSPAIRAVVLHVDSRGGSGLASDLIWREVSRLAEKKPVVAVMGEFAASGGYYVAAPAHHIVASPATLTGSIGVLAGKVNLGALLERLGIHTETLKHGASADLLSSSRAFTDEERQRMNDYIAALYRGFVDRVAEGRKIERDEVEALAQGRVWSGARAQKHGLVDELGSFWEAIAWARKKARIGRDAPLLVFGRPPGFSAPGLGLPFPLGPEAGRLLQSIADLDLVARDNALCLLPFEIRVR